MTHDYEDLIHRYLYDEISDEQMKRLEAALETDSDLRKRLVMAANLDAELREAALERLAEPLASSRSINPVIRQVTWFASAAAILFLAFMSGAWMNEPETVATLVSSENASWVSKLPTEPGSRLHTGQMRLVSGIATIQYDSGVRVILEAPAKMRLHSPMHMSLLGGTALVEIPDEALGFVVKTQNGYVDNGSACFAVKVKDGKTSTFDVLDGEISLHHPELIKTVKLKTRQEYTLSANEIKEVISPKKLIPRKQTEAIRIGINGRGTATLKNYNPKWMKYDVLMVKFTTPGGKNQRKSIFDFDISGVDLKQIEKASITLNQVESTIGYVSRLPEINRFALYGLLDERGESWDMDDTWNEMPFEKEKIKLGTFEIPRSVASGTYVIEGQPLMDFLRRDTTGKVTFILVRETGNILYKGLVHTFAKDNHAKASGPILTLVPKSR